MRNKTNYGIKFEKTALFISGFIIGILLFLTVLKSFELLKKKKSLDLIRDTTPYLSKDSIEIINSSNDSSSLYDESLADRLFNEVKILCWVFTHPGNHKTKVPHVRKTWGQRCNKLLFMSIEADPEHEDIIAIPVENGRSHLWNKTRLAMKFVYENYINDYDWFMRADDDNHMVIENLRYKLYHYHPQTSLYIGHRFADGTLEEGYMAGGGHIFSKKALTKFVTKIMNNETICQIQDSEFDDLLVGACLKNNAIFIDARDDKNQKQIFPIGVEAHMDYIIPDMNYWYWTNLWRNVTQGGLDCCSDVYIGSHYVSPEEIYLMEFLIYHLHPFGLQKNLTETLPRKYSLNEIISASDAKSIFSANYLEHERIHYFESDEKY